MSYVEASGRPPEGHLGRSVRICKPQEFQYEVASMFDVNSDIASIEHSANLCAVTQNAETRFGANNGISRNR